MLLYRKFLNIFIVTIAVPLVTEKSDHTATAFELKFVHCFDKPSPHFIGNQNICTPTLAVPWQPKNLTLLVSCLPLNAFVFGEAESKI